MSALPTIATESARARCTRGCFGVLHAAWWAARPLVQRTSDLHEAGPALQKSAAGRSSVLAAKALATVERRDPAPTAIRQGSSSRLALGSSNHQ